MLEYLELLLKYVKCFKRKILKPLEKSTKRSKDKILKSIEKIYNRNILTKSEINTKKL